MPHWSFILVPVVVFLNGASPYLGLKTENSFAMFSNLRTEGGVSNHFVVPASAQIFDFQKDMVEIVSSTDKDLQELANENRLMTYFEFKDYVASNKPTAIAYIRNGELYNFNLSEASQTQGLLTPNPYILRRVMGFREINKFDPQPCYH